MGVASAKALYQYYAGLLRWRKNIEIRGAGEEWKGKVAGREGDDCVGLRMGTLESSMRRPRVLALPRVLPQSSVFIEDEMRDLGELHAEAAKILISPAECPACSKTLPSLRME